MEEVKEVVATEEVKTETKVVTDKKKFFKHSKNKKKVCFIVSFRAVFPIKRDKKSNLS